MASSDHAYTYGEKYMYFNKCVNRGRLIFASNIAFEIVLYTEKVIRFYVINANRSFSLTKKK